MLFLATSGSANDVFKEFQGKLPGHRPGHGLAAWEALTEKYSSRTKEAGRVAKEGRRACHQKLANINMEPGQDPDDLFSFPDECRDLVETGHTVQDKRSKASLSQDPPAGYDRVRNETYDQRDFGPGDIQHMVRHTMYVDNFSSSRPLRTSKCAPRRASRSLNSRQWKDDWWGKATTASATALTIRPPGSSWRA